MLSELATTVPWVRRDSTPRLEAFYSELPDSYTYGSGGFARTYEPLPMQSNAVVTVLNNIITWHLATNPPAKRFELCFLNRYLNHRDHLGWHADDSPEIDANRPIAVLTLGAEREIWVKRQFCHICKSTETHRTDAANFCSAHPATWTPHIEKILLEHGSLFVMPAGFQQDHYHRIPKSDRECGECISLTYRASRSVLLPA